MGQLIFYLLLGIGACLIYVVKLFYRNLSNSNKAIRYCTKIFMIATSIGCVSYAFYLYTYRDDRAYKKLKESISIEKCQEFLDDYPQSEKCGMVRILIKEQYENELPNATDSLGLRKFITKYSNNYRYKEEFKKAYLDKAISMMNALNEEKLKKQNERIWNMMQNISSMKAESEKRNLRVDELFDDVNWGTDSKAWKTASESDMLKDYKRYLELYPNGRYTKQAQRKVIDLEVDEVFSSGNYGHLPSMDRISYSHSNYSRVSVKNDTRYTLTLLYSGTESKRLVIAPHNSKSVRLKSGTYRIVASVNAYNIRNFAGREELMGGSYEVSYYISTSRF